MKEALSKLLEVKLQLENKVKAIGLAIDVVESLCTEPVAESKPRRSGYTIFNGGATEVIRSLFSGGKRHTSRSLFEALKSHYGPNGVRFNIERKTVSAILTVMYKSGELKRRRGRCKTTNRRVFKYVKAESK